MIYRAAIVGCGRIGADINPPGIGSSRMGSHAEAYCASPRVSLIAACDADSRRAEDARRRWSIPHVYSDAREMIARERPDIVSLCTPVEARVDLLHSILSDSSVPAVLVEKPVAGTLAAADALAELAPVSRSVVAVNYVRRYVPSYRQLASEIRDGRLGRVQAVRGLYTKGIVNNGTHMIDLLRALFGEATMMDARGDATFTDPTLSFTLRFADTIDAVVHGLDHDAFSVFELDIIGTSGRVILSDLGHRLERAAVDDAVTRHGFRQLAVLRDRLDTDLRHGIGHAIEHVIDCLEQGIAPLCTLDDARTALALATNIRNAASGSFAILPC